LISLVQLVSVAHDTNGGDGKWIQSQRGLGVDGWIILQCIVKIGWVVAG